MMQALIKGITMNSKIIDETFLILVVKPKKMLIMHIGNVAGALHKPNDISLKA